MTKFIVHVREVWVQPVEVEAETEGEARIKANEGEGDIIEELLQYSHTSDDYKDWIVEKTAS